MTSNELAKALSGATPGDVLLLEEGTYRGNFQVRKSGSLAKPISLRGEGRAIIEGKIGDRHVFEISPPSHNLVFEGLTIRNGFTAIKANGCRNLVVRRCVIEDVNRGILSCLNTSVGWFVADNSITGRVMNWYPRAESSDSGVVCPGSGHVICHNRIRRFWDGISTAGSGEIPQEWASAAEYPQMAIDVFDNDVSEILDDGIECDDTIGNVRVVGNRIFNTHVALSAQPELGGPLYFIRNEIYNTTYAPFKLHNYPSGLVNFHNAAVGIDQGFASSPPAWRNATLRNNLFVGARKYAVETGSPDPATNLDYNGYFNPDKTTPFFKWSSDGDGSSG